ncbi:MlaD family protein [Nocardia nova]|uniref:MlaD family protein n=1 Tax=Nocardia nova TaxID=37330 RepID=UPI00371C92EE
MRSPRTVSCPTDTYSATFGDLLGLQAGDDVRVAGVRVGKVVTIALDRNNHATVNRCREAGRSCPWYRVRARGGGAAVAALPSRVMPINRWACRSGCAPT